MAEISFGIEYEFDFISPSGQVFTNYSGARFAHVEAWGVQDDPTAGAEIWTPVFTSVEEAVESHERQWNEWISRNEPIVPYMCNRTNRSIGVHIHLGLPTRDLEPSEKVKIARAIAIAYPYLMALHAQPIPSNRGLTTRYAYPIWRANYHIPIQDHYAEISASHNGTVEFRIFDSNIPQVSLTCVTLMKAIAEKVLEDRSGIVFKILDNIYRRDRERALRFGVIGLDVVTYLKYIKSVAGNIELPRISSVREILYLSAKYFMNVWNVKQTLHVKDYDWFELQLKNPKEFLRNITHVIPPRFRSKVERWMREVQNVNTLEDLIRIAENSRNVFLKALESQVERSRVTCVSALRDRVASGEINIVRIGEVPHMERNEVAGEIEYLLRESGDSMVHLYTAREIIESPSRYYVAYVRDPVNERAVILGAVAINMSNGEIGSLVVDRRYRRLGVGRRLVTHVMNLGLSRYKAFIRRGNEASLRLFESLGFRIVQEYHDGVMVEYQRR
jgi:ribosomal protein S18 acetylase RimI-like enzyme